MSIPVEFDPREGVIRVSVDIKTPLPWGYKYKEKNVPATYSRKSGDKPEPPHSYELGLPAQMNYDTNTFTLSIWNATSDPHDFSLSVKWTQDDSSGGLKLLKEYPFKGTLAPGSSPCDVMFSVLFLERKP